MPLTVYSTGLSAVIMERIRLGFEWSVPKVVMSSDLTHSQDFSFAGFESINRAMFFRKAHLVVSSLVRVSFMHWSSIRCSGVLFALTSASMFEM